MKLTFKTVFLLFALLFTARVQAQNPLGILQDSLSNDTNGNGVVNPGDGVRYKATITNRTGMDAQGVNYNNAVPAHTTLVPGSVRTSALARNDQVNTFTDVPVHANVLNNDFGLPLIKVTRFGTSSDPILYHAGDSGLTDQGGIVSLDSAGNIMYTPPMGYAGTDQFWYRATTGIAPDNDAMVTINIVNTGITFSATVINPSCSGDSSGSIIFYAVNGGTPGYVFSVTGPFGTYQNADTFLNLPAGTYQLVVKDAAGAVKPMGIATLRSLQVSSPVLHHVTLSCLNDGAAQITATGGATPYTYSWAPGNPAGDSTHAVSGIAGSATGLTYSVTVTDSNGCTASQNIIIYDSSQLEPNKAAFTCFIIGQLDSLYITLPSLSAAYFACFNDTQAYTAMQYYTQWAYVADSSTITNVITNSVKYLNGTGAELLNNIVDVIDCFYEIPLYNDIMNAVPGDVYSTQFAQQTVSYISNSNIAYYDLFRQLASAFRNNDPRKAGQIYAQFLKAVANSN